MSACEPPGSGSLADLLRERGIVDEAERQALLARRPGPWWLMLLQALAAWFASLLIVSALVLPAAGLGTAGGGVVGVVLCIAAIASFRRGGLFTDQMGLALSLTGQGLLMWTAAEWFEPDAWRQMAGVGVLVSGAMSLPRASRLHRVVCGLLLSVALGVLIGSGFAGEAFGIVLMAVAVLACITRERWAAQPWGGVAGALMLAFGLAALVLPPMLMRARTAFLFEGVDHRSPMIWLAAGAALVLIVLLAHLLRTAPPASRLAACGVALLWALVFHAAPGLIVAVGVFIAAFQASQRTLAGFALLAAVLYVGEFYYLLDVSLLHKSGLLVLGGAVLLALRAWVLRIGAGVRT
ncbi:DUF4401 domain-containing protein [Thauera butanivorans]|uniref:DUF4401 domain-containing protein n=1 Tax=Thauera butanivorans TaxID=86174 RepID=UPI003AB1F9B6